MTPFFCSTALQAFFRPDRRHVWPPRAEAVNDGLLGPPEGLVIDGREHGGRLGGRGPEECMFPIDLSPQNRIEVAASSTVLYVVLLHWPHHKALGFRRRYSPKVLSTGWHTKNRAVVEARPGRDSFPLLTQSIVLQ